MVSLFIEWKNDSQKTDGGRTPGPWWCRRAAYPDILYTFREGKLLRLHAACDALWREDRLSS